MEKRLIRNSIRTPDGTVLVSRHRHDYVSHLDANGETYYIDGGFIYRRGSINVIPAEDLCVYDDAPYEIIRETIERGTYGLNGDEPLKYVVLSEIDNDWLQAIIDYEELNRPNNPYLKYYKLEKEFRKNGKS